MRRTDPVSTLAVFTELRVDPTLFYLVFGESVSECDAQSCYALLYLVVS